MSRLNVRTFVYCPQCCSYRYRFDFYRNGRTHRHNWLCNKCDRENSKMLELVDTQLEGITIPVYEKPVKKYFIAPAKLNK